MEAGDPSVSLDLLIRSLITLGASDRELSQIIATPRATQRDYFFRTNQERNIGAWMVLRDRVAVRPWLAACLASERHSPFNQEGIIRLYPELDDRSRGKRRKAIVRFRYLPAA